MKRERRQPTRREWQQITSRWAVVRRVIRRDTPCKGGYPMQAGEVLPRSDGASLFSSNAPLTGPVVHSNRNNPMQKRVFRGAKRSRMRPRE